ncbi:MAG: class I SAM-dependent methyltransferase [Anaeromyxobacteraceae bacterium]
MSDAPWWSDEGFWEEMFDFIFPPEHLALGDGVARRAAALAGLAPGARLLDLGCGPGRVAVPLARLGYRVTGLDFQASYLARARAAAEQAGVEVELARGDISAPGFDQAFDAVLCLFTSFSYFADRAQDARVLRGAWHALRPGGRFVLETAHRDGVVRLMHVREADAPGGRHFREEPRFDPVTGVLEARWTVESAAGSRSFTSRMRPYSATELAAMLAEAGFVDVRFHRDLDGGAPSLDSYEVVAVGTRPE